MDMTQMAVHVTQAFQQLTIYIGRMYMHGLRVYLTAQLFILLKPTFRISTNKLPLMESEATFMRDSLKYEDTLV